MGAVESDWAVDAVEAAVDTVCSCIGRHVMYHNREEISERFLTENTPRELFFPHPESKPVGV